MKSVKSINTIDVLYDGSCQFWVRITRLVKRLDRGQYIHLTNIADRKFEARIYDKSQSELMADLHVRLSDGTWLKGSDAFRELFSNEQPATAGTGFEPAYAATTFQRRIWTHHKHAAENASPRSPTIGLAVLLF